MKIKLTGISKDERQRGQGLTIEEKVKKSERVIEQIFDKFGAENTAVAWTGGKDSTLLLWLVRNVCQRRGAKLPQAMFVDEGDVFEEIWEFVNKMKRRWQVEFSVAHNSDVSSQAKKLGDVIKVIDLNERNQKEVQRLKKGVEEFEYWPESFIGNHLMKTVATNMWLEKSKAQVLFVGVRWDEQPARAEDDYLRPLKNPDHFRGEPILHFREEDIWEAIQKYKVPFVKLYKQGYRSLGAKTTTDKISDKPAWEQDFEHTTERGGRQQDKENIMEQLRALGYM